MNHESLNSLVALELFVVVTTNYDLVININLTKMPRRSELLEEERNYRLVKREKEETGKFIKQALRFLFSQVGIVFLGVFTAVMGNNN